MKNLMVLVISVLLFTGCWKDIAGDIIIGAAGSILETHSEKNRKEECEKYKAEFKWEKHLKGDPIDMENRNQMVYILKKINYKKYIISEINILTGKTNNYFEFNPSDFEDVYNSTNNSIDELIVFVDNSNFGMILAYNRELHKVVWLKKGENLNKQIVDGFIFNKQVKYSNDHKEFFINRINAITGETKMIYEFPVTWDNYLVKSIESLQAFKDRNGRLLFSFAFSITDDSGNIIINVSTLDFDNKHIKIIYRYLEKNYRFNRNIITQDNNNLYLNIKGDIFCYSKETGEEIWSYFSTFDNTDPSKSFICKGEFLIIDNSSNFQVINKISGEYTLTSPIKYGKSHIKIYKDNILYTDSNFLYRLDMEGHNKNKIISKAYCETSSSRNNQNFIVTDFGTVVTSDNSYIRRLILK